MAMRPNSISLDPQLRRTAASPMQSRLLLVLTPLPAMARRPRTISRRLGKQESTSLVRRIASNSCTT
jgi:hypothetical protein